MRTSCDLRHAALCRCARSARLWLRERRGRQPKRFRAPGSIRREARSKQEGNHHGPSRKTVGRTDGAVDAALRASGCHRSECDPRGWRGHRSRGVPGRPRTTEELQQLVGTASEGAEATPGAAQAGSMEGEDADEATVQAVTQTYRQLVACLNAGQFLRVYALYTDDYLRRTLADSGIDPQQFQATPAPDRGKSRRSRRERGPSARGWPGYGAGRNRLLTRGRIHHRSGRARAAGDSASDRGRDRDRCDRTPEQLEPLPPRVGGEQASAGQGASEAVEVDAYDIYFEPKELTSRPIPM